MPDRQLHILQGAESEGVTQVDSEEGAAVLARPRVGQDGGVRATAGGLAGGADGRRGDEDVERVPCWLALEEGDADAASADALPGLDGVRGVALSGDGIGAGEGEGGGQAG